MKSEFDKATVKYFDHIVGQEQVRPLDTKIQTIVKFPIPTSQKELARFLCMTGYYRNFCLNFSETAAPLTNLLSKKLKFVWTDDCQLAKSSYCSKFLFEFFGNCCSVNKFVKQNVKVLSGEMIGKVKLLRKKSPVLKSPDYKKSFKLIVDSSDVGTGAVLV